MSRGLLETGKRVAHYAQAVADDGDSMSAKRQEAEAVFRQYLAVTGDLEKVTEMRVEHDPPTGWTCTFELSDGWSGEYRYLGNLHAVDDDSSP